MSIGLETTANEGARNDEIPAKHRMKLTDFPHELLLKIFGYVIADIHYQAESTKTANVPFRLPPPGASQGNGVSFVFLRSRSTRAQPHSFRIRRQHWADQATYYDSVMNLSVIISPTQLTDAPTLVSHLAPILDRCEEVASVDVLFTQATSNGRDRVIQGDDEAVTMIKTVVAEYGKRVDKTVRTRWLTDDVLHLLQ
ncbi:hypothetical protein LTR17_014212 [Elasticomyces elasticus]|nr:hypothetical protein LTR17_014212 [Elasticomyces elasticus]